MTDVPPLALPVLAQVFWTLVVLTGLGAARLRAIRQGHARVPGLALSKEGWPDDVRKVSNNFDNQFQVPVLFYVICGAATILETAGPLMTALAWFFVASRVAHTAVHVTTNYIPLRFGIFMAGFVALVIMYVLTAAGYLVPATS